jgi:hypothetical protein
MRAERITDGCRVDYGGQKIEITLCKKHRTMMANWYEMVKGDPPDDSRSLFDMVEHIMKEGCRP